MDLVVTPANVKPGAKAKPNRGTSAAAIEAGQTVYKLADGRFGLGDANGTSPADTPAGVACCSCPGADQGLIWTNDAPDFDPGATTEEGQPYFQSGTPGGICPKEDLEPGMKTSLIGFGKADNKMVIKVVASGQAIQGS